MTFFGAIKTFLQRDIFQTHIKKGHSCFKLCFMSFWGEVCVCYRFASGVSADGLKFATRTYIKREFDTKMSKTKFFLLCLWWPNSNILCCGIKLAKWARKKKIWCRSVVLDNFLGAMVLGSLQWLCRGVLLLLHIVGQGPAVLAAGARRVGYIFF